MEFYSATLKRPKRLSEQTRKFAYESLNHKYGLDTKKTMAISLDNFTNFNQLSDLQKYDLAIQQIALNAPIRICENEKISGAATLGQAIFHAIPVTYKNNVVLGGISHLTINYEMILKHGLLQIEKNVDTSLNTYKSTEKEPFLISCKNCIHSFKEWHKRYLNVLKHKPDYHQNYQNLLQVPLYPAKNFYQAVQSLWFTFAFVRLCGNWPGIGRIDYLLNDFLQKDLKEGNISLDEAREILAHFFIKGCEWVCGGDYFSGDAQHYQNIVLAGVDENGIEIANDVTYLVLDILEELNIGDFPTSIRLNKKTPLKLLQRTAEVIRYGGGVIALYNEDLVIQSLLEYGYSLKEARKFANDGCWEVQIPGKTYFIYTPFDSLKVLQEETLKKYEENLDFKNFNDLYQAFISDLAKTAKRIATELIEYYDVTPIKNGKDWKWKKKNPCTIVSLFEDGCIEKGLSYLEGGPIYNLHSLHIGGLPDTINSLYLIKKIVFDDKIMNLNDFMKVLYNNWEKHEELRLNVTNKYLLFGNDNDEVDEIYAHLVDDFAHICNNLNGNCGCQFPAGISTFGRQIEWAKHRLATPFGKRKGEILSGNTSPTPGSDKEGVTAIIQSYCKADLKKMTSGAALDIKLLPSSIMNDNGLETLISLMKGFVKLNGFFMQLDVADANILKKAQEAPQDYQTLSVRVSGWNARFVTLDKSWQDMIIQQIEK